MIGSTAPRVIFKTRERSLFSRLACEALCFRRGGKSSPRKRGGQMEEAIAGARRVGVGASLPFPPREYPRPRAPHVSRPHVGAGPRRGEPGGVAAHPARAGRRRIG